MKLEQDTTTKADIGLETNDLGDRWSTGQKVRDKWWKTHKGEQAKEPDIPTQAGCWFGDKLIGRHVARDTWWETSEIRQKTSGEPDTNRQRGRQMKDNYSCTTPHYIQQLWQGNHCNHCNHSKKIQLQPPVGPSVDSPCHPWSTTTNPSYRFPIFETSATALWGTTGIVHFEAREEPETTSQTWDTWIGRQAARLGTHELGNKWRQTSKQPDTTSQTVWQIWYLRQVKADVQRAGRRQPDSQTDELGDKWRQTSKEPDTTSQTVREMNWRQVKTNNHFPGQKNALRIKWLTWLQYWNSNTLRISLRLRTSHPFLVWKLPRGSLFAFLSVSIPQLDLASFSFMSIGMCSCTKQTDVLSAVTSLAGGAGRRGLVCLGPTLGFQPSMIMMARASNLQHDRGTSSGSLSNHTICCNRICLLCQFWLLCAPAPSRPTWCRLSPRWPGVLDDTTVLGANARFLTEYDSKGYGLMSLAGHTPKRWPVSSRPCDCQTFRPALHGAWEASFLTHTTVAHATLAYTTLLQALSYTQLVHTHAQLFQHNLTHTTLAHTQLLHTHTSHLSNTHAHTHTQLFHVQLFKTYWSSTTSFAFPSFRVPLQL